MLCAFGFQTCDRMDLAPSQGLGVSMAWCLGLGLSLSLGLEQGTGVASINLHLRAERERDSFTTWSNEQVKVNACARICFLIFCQLQVQLNYLWTKQCK